MLLSIIIPVYNEELTIGDIIDRVKAAVQQTGLKSEIIVVDDHSYDRSLEVAKKHRRQNLHAKAASGQRLCVACRFCQSKRRRNSHHRLRRFTSPEELPEVLGANPAGSSGLRHRLKIPEPQAGGCTAD